ncbi:winged helix-turn-helix transcriptional regulator [Actinomadura macrotermitis]|uniref:Putative HTH-type transcriptional regulator n=1 Tax=Actinomadura macrotermitis TaxID=2585200 RepID=A0A7K0BQZ2_9ACTN|nr:helix-turn-helix domain-containing protein [Actinomadura macrotermitis]MQY03579.1 putative HTH-type transcriptional regulator [Actinomadura macrotermitis]
MQRTSFGSIACSVARTLDLAGEPWSLLVVRDVFVGINRFDALRRDLGISRKVLSERLQRLADEGVLERRAYSEHPPRHEYHLTPKGLELCEVMFAIVAWGDRWTAGEAGPPALLRHERCGSLTRARVCCSECGEPLHASEVRAEAGPGGSNGPGTVLMAERLQAR